MVTNCSCNGNCSRCGECCTPMLPITLDEYYKIKAYVEEHKVPYINPCKPEGVYIKCPFFDPEKRKCNIYEVRPEVCREFICSKSNKYINKARKYYDSRADINGNHLDRFVPMDLLFFDSPILSLMIAMKMLDCNTPYKMYMTLQRLGDDTEFFKKYNIPSSRDINKEIAKGNIKLEWSDEK